VRYLEWYHVDGFESMHGYVHPATHSIEVVDQKRREEAEEAFLSVAGFADIKGIQYDELGIAGARVLVFGNLNKEKTRAINSQHLKSKD
jgi:hypothetical protein